MADSVASWVDEESKKRDSEWTRERSEEKKKKKESSSESKNSSAMKHLAKRLKAIYEDEGLDYGDVDDDEEAIVDRFSTATKLRKKRVAEVFRSIRRARNVELCFLVDSTGSMGPHIQGVKESIQKIVEKLTDSGLHVSFGSKKETPEVQNLKLAFIAYRDFGDLNQFEVLPFTNSTSKFQNFCLGIEAIAGFDPPEDVFGGLENALNLNWSENAGTKVVFHICDSPCHGNDFHNDLIDKMNDRYPYGDPNGRNHRDLFMRLKAMGIQYHFGKITNYTDLMISKFSEVYGEKIMEFDVKRVDDIRESVITAVSVSVSASISSSKASSGIPRKEREYKFDKVEPNWEFLPERKGKFMSYDFPDSIKDVIDDVPLNRRQSKTATVKVAGNPFSKGAERVAYYGLDLSTFVDEKKKTKSLELKQKNEKIVLKEYLHLGKGMNSAKRYELSNQMQTIASYLALKFSQELQEKLGTAVVLKFLKIKTIFIGSDKGERFMSCERRFAETDKFVRFTNNAFYELTEKKAIELGVSVDLVHQIMAFSHWTYKVTKGFLMVVDLEGIISKEISTGKTIVILTDPAIHCKDVTRYGKMNHGPDGISGFFSKHSCNRFCSILGLEGTRPRKDSD